jgi:hypothetical protein
MKPTTEIAISLNTEVMGQVGKEGKWPMLAYHAALAKLKPVKGAQIISLDDQEDKVIKGANRLCEIGVLKPFAGSRTKFYVPKTVAFATNEPRMEAP